ncbi:hypothetical protein SH2C18_50820 [Clostridium sediminicola]|uniref:DUF6106 family protein n=1 Tax=Clostridium sediminicola TaxID=3114879 RepID=UPI0031F22BD2
MDQFYEQLLVTKKTTLYKVANVMMYVFAVFGVIIFSANVIIGILLIGLAGAIFFLKKKLYVEYEYDFTNGEIDIDQILEMKKRVRVLTFKIKDVELLANETSFYAKDFSNKPSKVMTFLPSSYEGKIYVAMLTGGNERVMIRFAPNEKFLNLCFKLNPRAVKKDS